APVPVRFEWANALALPYEAGSFDAATVGFGARNFADLGQGIAEMARVVRPGGRVVILEITTPQRPPLAWFYMLWFDRAVPALGRLAGDQDAYTYLPSSVRRFPDPRELAGVMAGCGLAEIRWIVTAVGLIASATLVRDDVLDAAELRRGRPTVVAAAGRGIASATGDLLFSRAFAELARNQRPDEVRVLSDASSALVQGELLQRADAF